MNKKLSMLLMTILAGSSVNSLANTPAKPHSYGAHIASGGAEFRDLSSDGDGVVQLYGFYNYAFTENFALEAGINFGSDVDEWECYEDQDDDWHCSKNNKSLFDLGLDEIEYTNVVLAVKGMTAVSQRNSLYAKVGAQFYDYELSRNHQALFTDDGAGLYLAAGWEYQWDMGIGMSVGFERFDMDELVTNSVHVGINYHF